MSATKPDTDTGWTREFPTEIGYLWVRTEQYRELPAEFDGRSVTTLYGIRLFPDDLVRLQPEFLGPISPSDFEQLIRLRKAAEVARAWICRVTNQYYLGADDPHEVLVALREALANTGEHKKLREGK